MQPCDRDQLPLYDKLLPWLCGAPLEHHLATVAPAGLGAAEWRSPQCAATDGWRYLTFSLRVLLLEVAQFSTSKAKLLKWYLGYFLGRFWSWGWLAGVVVACYSQRTRKDLSWEVCEWFLSTYYVGRLVIRQMAAYDMPPGIREGSVLQALWLSAIFLSHQKTAIGSTEEI